jgi:pimeloyl-ACP methyl ester carboxylesterase
VKELVRVDGRRIAAYDLIGNGPMLLCIPGGPGYGGDQLDELGGLDEFRTLVRLDLRGAGESDEPESQTWTFDDYAADLEVVREHLGLETVTLFGHAHGGLVAAAYALRFPERVEALVLDGMPVKAVHEFDTGTEDDVPAYFHAYNARARQYVSLHMDNMYEPALAWFWDHEAARNFPRMLSTVSSRSLLISGDEDPMAGADANTKMASHMPNARAVSVKAASHFAWVEEPRAYVEAVLEFVDARS